MRIRVMTCSQALSGACFLAVGKDAVRDHLKGVQRGICSPVLPTWVNWPNTFFFLLKIALVGLGYAVLLRHLLNAL